jgi:hypothetical protein
MNTLSSLKLLVAAALIGIAAGNARSQEATPDVSNTPAGQTAATGTGYVPGWYPPRPDRRGYAQPWPQSSQRPAPPPGYGGLRPYAPAHGQYWSRPGIPAENPLGTELKQTQEQLAAQSTELETTRQQLARLQADLETATAALQKAQSDTLNAGRQVDASMTEVDALRKILCELAARIEIRKTMLQDALQTAAAEPDEPDSTTGGEVEPETAALAEPQTDPQCSQQTPTPAITSGQRGITVKAQAR